MSKIRSHIKKLNEMMNKIVPENSGIRVYTLNLPVDVPDDVAERMEAEARSTIPEMDGLAYDSVIVMRWTGDGSKYDPSETWTLEGGNIQQCVR